MNTDNVTIVTVDTVATVEFFEAQDKQLAGLQVSYENPAFIGNIETGRNASSERLKTILSARKKIKIALEQLEHNEPVSVRYGYCKRCGHFLGKDLLSKAPLAIEHGRECPRYGKIT